MRPERSYYKNPSDSETSMLGLSRGARGHVVVTCGSYSMYGDCVIEMYDIHGEEAELLVKDPNNRSPSTTMKILEIGTRYGVSDNITGRRRSLGGWEGRRHTHPDSLNTLVLFY